MGQRLNRAVHLESGFDVVGSAQPSSRIALHRRKFPPLLPARETVTLPGTMS
jgi:hypothetical protein